MATGRDLVCPAAAAQQELKRYYEELLAKRYSPCPIMRQFLERHGQGNSPGRAWARCSHYHSVQSRQQAPEPPVADILDPASCSHHGGYGSNELALGPW